MNLMRGLNRAGVMVMVAVVCAMLCGARARGDGVTADHWYVVEMQGQRCGHMHAQTIQKGDRFISKSDMSMELRRGEVVVRISIGTDFTETAEGRPVRIRSETKMGTLPTVMEYVFKPDGVDVTHVVGGGGEKHRETKPLPEGDWMTPMAAERYVTEQIAAGAREIVVRTIEPSTGLNPAKTTMKLVERTTLEVVGKTVPAIKWKSTNELVANVESTDYTDDRGVPLRTETDIGGIKLVLTRADKALAMSKARPPELLESTFIIPDKQIDAARESTKGVFLMKAGAVAIGEWPSAGAQVVEKVDEGTLRVSVENGRSSEATKAEVESGDFRKPSSMVNSTDERVVELKNEALKGAEKGTAERKAEMLRAFVHKHISKKNFDVGFASAAETARTRCGDCTEHAVLLCALLRAADMPARCVSGLVYVDGIGKGGKGAFGYHMWTQVMLEDGAGKWRWHDLDAALDADSPMDATHIAIQTLSLADGQTINALMDILPTLGKLRIAVEEVK